MKIAKTLLIFFAMTSHTLCDGQVSFVNFPDSFKTSCKHYSPIHKPVSKSAMWGIISIGQPYDSLILWPSTPVYDPNKFVLDKYKDSIKPSFVIIVDTSQDLDCYEYFFWIEKDKKYYPDQEIGYIENEQQRQFNAKTTNQAIFKGYPVYLVNLSDTTIRIRHRKYQVPLVQEALDTDGLWKPIETLFSLPPGVKVTNYSGISPLKSGEMMVSSIYNYKGQFQTMLRVKIMIEKTPYYSQPFKGSINHSQLTSKKTYKFN